MPMLSIVYASLVPFFQGFSAEDLLSARAFGLLPAFACSWYCHSTLRLCNTVRSNLVAGGGAPDTPTQCVRGWSERARAENVAATLDCRHGQHSWALPEERRFLSGPTFDYAFAKSLRTRWEVWTSVSFILVWLSAACVNTVSTGFLGILALFGIPLGLCIYAYYQTAKADNLCKVFEALAPRNLAEVFPETENLLASHG